MRDVESPDIHECFHGLTGSQRTPKDRGLTLYLEDEARQELSIPRVVCEYEDNFSDELPGLPLYRDVDFTIELHLSTSPISMTPHRMAPAKLQELKVQL